MNVVYCEHPRTIFNTALVRIAIQEGSLFMFRDGHIVSDYCCFTSHYYENTKMLRNRVTNQLRHIVYSQNIEYFVVPSTGEQIPATMQVPCNHCSLCRKKKQRQLASRAKLECQQHDYLPFFVTLTYDDDHLPKNGNLCYRDVQLFLKRLRIMLVREKQWQDSFRYFVAGEYGSKTHRAHYHILLYGFPNWNILEVDEFVRKAWKNGLTCTKRCQDGDAGYYCAKYACKSVEDGQHDVDPFHRCSINLGVDFFLKTAAVLRTNPEQSELQYMDKFDGTLKRLPLFSYYVNKLFPTTSNLPAALRDALRDYIVCMYDVAGTDVADSLASTFAQLDVKLPESLLHTSARTYPFEYSQFLSCDWLYFYISRYAGRDLSCMDENAALRSRLFERLIQSMPDFNVSNEVYKVTKENESLINSEIL